MTFTKCRIVCYNKTTNTTLVGNWEKPFKKPLLQLSCNCSQLLHPDNDYWVEVSYEKHKTENIRLPDEDKLVIVKNPLVC